MNANVRVRPLRRVEYDVLVEQGFFGEDDRIQLFDGELVAMSPQHSPHARMVEALNERLMPAWWARRGCSCSCLWSPGSTSSPGRHRHRAHGRAARPSPAAGPARD